MAPKAAGVGFDFVLMLFLMCRAPFVATKRPCTLVGASAPQRRRAEVEAEVEVEVEGGAETGAVAAAVLGAAVEAGERAARFFGNLL